MGLNGGMGRLLVDVVVVNPVAPSNIERRSDASVAKSVEKGEKKLTAIEQAERTKKSKYVKLAEMLNATFVPFACDVFGGMGKSAHSPSSGSSARRPRSAASTTRRRNVTSAIRCTRGCPLPSNALSPSARSADSRVSATGCAPNGASATPALPRDRVLTLPSTSSCLR